MNPSIEINLLKKHFFLDFKQPYREKSEETVGKYKQLVHKMVSRNFYSLNELNVSKKIKNIHNYFHWYLVVEDYEILGVQEFTGENFSSLKEILDDSSFFLYNYRNLSLTNFGEFFADRGIRPKTHILSIIRSFSYILKSLATLNKNGVCYFNLSPENIWFPFKNREKPLLRNFQYSIITDRNTLNEEYITNILKNKKICFTHKPLEVHILFYLIQNNLSSISYSFIEEVCAVFIENMGLLSFFSPSFKENYTNLCKVSLKKYINKPRDFIINDILSSIHKWDIYSLSYSYIYIIGNITKFFSLKQTFLNKLLVELVKNIHPEPSKRERWNQLYETYNRFFTEFQDWDFVNRLHYE